MNNIVKIPGLALLTLSLTDCVDRNGPDQDPIVGDWHAVKLDADVFPMLLSGDGEETYTLNVELSVKPDLQGTLLAMGALLSMAFLLAQRRTRHPMLPLTLFTQIGRAHV